MIITYHFYSTSIFSTYRINAITDLLLQLYRISGSRISLYKNKQIKKKKDKTNKVKNL